MYPHVQSKMRKNGMRYTVQVIDKNISYGLGTFDSKERADLSAKLFIFWCERMPEANRHRLKNNYLIDAI